MLLALKMEPKEAKALLAQNLNLTTEAQKADFNYMIVDAYGRSNLYGMEKKFEDQKCKDVQFYQTWHTARHEGLSMRKMLTALNISRNKYYAEMEYPERIKANSTENRELHKHDLDLSSIERVLKLAKEYPIL
jgi:hypothetical protein